MSGMKIGERTITKFWITPVEYYEAETMKTGENEKTGEETFTIVGPLKLKKYKVPLRRKIKNFIRRIFAWLN